MIRSWLTSLLFLAPHFAGASPPEATPAAAPSIVRVPFKGSPPKVDPSVKLTGAEFELLTIQGYVGPVTWDCASPTSFGSPVKLVEAAPKSPIIGLRVGTTEPDVYTTPDTPSVAVFAINTGNVTLSCWGVDKTGKPVKLATFQIAANLGPQPPPVDPNKPKPPEPKPPVVVTSFRVILVYESADTLTAAQNSVLYGKEVENWLNANCTGGKAGWRRRDKDLSGENDPAIVAVWDAVKAEFASPKNTKTPAVAIQVNDKIDIIPLAATPAEMVATLTKYLKGQ